jgi:hypothetical protein
VFENIKFPHMPSVNSCIIAVLLTFKAGHCIQFHRSCGKWIRWMEWLGGGINKFINNIYG